VLALRNFGRFTSYEDFARWCHVRARWLALDELARSRRHPEEPIESVAADLVDEQRTDLAELVPFIEKLPEQQRAVVVYKVMGYRTDEIARALGIQDSGVRSHWRYAQQSLSRMVSET